MSNHSLNRLLVLDAWIEVGIEEVVDQIDRHDHEGKEKVDHGDQQVVPVEKRIDHQPSEARGGSVANACEPQRRRPIASPGMKLTERSCAGLQLRYYNDS